MSKTIVLVGPTGVGKTELSLRLAERYGCAIINADSRQIYRELPIGTAAPTAAEQARVKHYLVGTHELNESYNAGQFVRDAEAILSREPAVISGGAMLYVDALIRGIDEMPEVSPDIREQVQADYAEKGLPWLQAEVERLDPAYYGEVDRSNPQRLMRCVEICRATGRTYSEFRSGRTESAGDREYLLICLERDREELYERINRRVDQMIADGLEEEARRAFGRLQAPTVGYAEFFRYFEGEISRERAIELIKQNSRHYAKRQMTWWRRNTDIHRLKADDDYEVQIHTIDTWLGADEL